MMTDTHPPPPAAVPHGPRDPITLRSFRAADAAAVIAHVLAIQRQEFGMAISAGDQPDLLDIAAHYQRGAGGFWLALAGDQLLGTLGLLDIGGGHGVLRKMFVAADARGHRGVAAALLAAALRHGRAAGLHTLWLGTTEAFVAAHRFYEKYGFERIEPDTLPATFPRMAVDTRFYRRALGPAEAVPC